MAGGTVLAGWVLLGVGGLLIVIAIILIIYLMTKRRRGKRLKRAKSQDTFKVVYKVPTSNGTTTKSDMLDARSIHTLRSEPGYRYVAPPIQPTVVPPVHMAPPSIVMSNSTLPRASSVDHVSVTLPRTGERYLVPAPNGTLPRILLPVSKKNKYKKGSKAKPLLVYDGPAASVMSAPTYATSVRSVPAYATSSRSIPAYATHARPMTSANNNKYHMYGSTPNLASAHQTQPVLMYDGRKRIFSDDVVGGNAHVQNWLTHEEPTSLPGDDPDFARPASRLSASSAPDVHQLSAEALHMRWSPSMRRRLQEMDRREQMEETERNTPSGSGSHLQQEVAPDGKRYTPLHHYTELSEEF